MIIPGDQLFIVILCDRHVGTVISIHQTMGGASARVDLFKTDRAYVGLTWVEVASSVSLKYFHIVGYDVSARIEHRELEL